MLTLILQFSELVRTVLRYSHGFHLLPVLARIQQCSGTHTDSTIFPYWSGQFFGTRTDCTFCRYLPGFSNVPMLTLILTFSVLVRTVLRYSQGFHLLPVLARIQQCSSTHTDSTIFSTHPDSFKVLARILPFAGTCPDSTFFRYSH